MVLYLYSLGLFFISRPNAIKPVELDDTQCCKNNNRHICHVFIYFNKFIPKSTNIRSACSTGCSIPGNIEMIS